MLRLSLLRMVEEITLGERMKYLFDFCHHVCNLIYLFGYLLSHAERKRNRTGYSSYHLEFLRCRKRNLTVSSRLQIKATGRPPRTLRKVSRKTAYRFFF